VSVVVLFDLDGTLLDHRAAAAEAVASVFGPCDVSEWFRLEDLYFGTYLRGALTFQEQRRHRLADFLGLPVSEDLDPLFAQYLDAYARAWTAYPDVVPALTSLSAAAGIRLGVLTNGQQEQQLAKLAAIGVLPLLEGVIASSTLPAAKPDPAAFLTACDRLSCEPAQTWYVGDNLQTDALAASAAGLRGVWLNRGGLPGPVDGPPMVTDLHGAVGLLLG
jgi:putative hydrolase of the HAD superfamily